jgi:hypothetical protein
MADEGMADEAAAPLALNAQLEVPSNDSFFTLIDNNATYKCNLCDKTWSKKTLTATYKSAHLSNVMFSKEKGVRLCPRVPPAVSERNVSHFNKHANQKRKSASISEAVQSDHHNKIVQLAAKKMKDTADTGKQVTIQFSNYFLKTAYDYIL